MSEQKEQITTDNDLIYKYNRELFYHFDKEKGFTQKVDYQNPDNQIIIKQSWDAAEQRLEEARQRVIAGIASPVAYHMERILMEVPMLAAYMELPKWRVKRHLKPRVFKKLKTAHLEKYASIFEITVDELTNPEFLKSNDKTRI
jgi:hypothetical protein